MNKLLLTLALFSTFTHTYCQTNPKPTKKSMTTLDGIYNLTGIMEMAAGFKFTPDGRFEFYYVYGASDRNATGTYTIEGDTVKLKSDKIPGQDFKIESQSKKGNGFTIVIKAPNDFLLNNVACLYFVGETQEYVESNSKGIIQIDLPAVDKLYLRHEFFPDIPTLIKDTDNANNHFEVSLLPSLSQVSFKGIDLFIKEDTLTCHPNYFMMFENIRFVKE